MRIIVFSEVFWPEDFLVNDLVREWVKMGHKVDVVTQYPSYPQSFVYKGYKNKGYITEDWEGVKIHRYPFIEGYRDSKFKKIWNYYEFVKGGKAVVDSLNNDYDCAFVSQTGPLTVVYPALYLKKKLGIPVNVWTCDIWPDTVWAYGISKNAVTKRLLDGLIRNIYAGCDRIFVSSQRFAETINKYSDKECIYSPNWLRPVHNVESSLRLEPGKVHFTFTGNVSRFQNLMNVVEGFVKAELPDAQLNIVGDGSYLKEVRLHAMKLRATNIFFHGRRPYNEIHDILTQSNILLLPLISDEGIEKTEPYKIQSYLQSGKPIFGVLNGSGRDIIEENELGVCADPSDIDAIAVGFKKIIDFSSKHEKDIAERSMSLMETRFNKHEIVSHLTQNLIHR